MAKKTRTKAPKGVSKEAVTHELKTVLLFGAGVVAGSMGGSMIDKLLNVDSTDPAMNVKKFVRPLVLIGTGTIAGLKMNNENLRHLAKGVAAAGVLSAVKIVLKKDLLNGLEGFEGANGLNALSEAVMYTEPFMGSPNYTPDLPMLEASPIDEYPAISAADEPLQLPQTTIEISSIDAIGEVVDVEII